MSGLGKRRRGALSAVVEHRQLDLFALDEGAERSIGTLCAVQAQSMQRQRPPSRVGRGDRVEEKPQPNMTHVAFGLEEWWTTRSVCAFLKIGRKALWSMRRDPASDFPAPVDVVGHRHLYLAADVRAWMEARRQDARGRAEVRRQALTQFHTNS